MKNGMLVLTVAVLGAVLGGCSGGGGSGTSEGSGGSNPGGGGTTSTSTTHGGSGGSTAHGGGGTSTGATSTGGTSTGGTTTGGTSTGGTTTTTTTSTGDDATLAIHSLLVGDTLPNGAPSSTAWKGYGLNLDGKVSTGSSVDLCKPAAGGNPNSVYPDGNDGIDNNWGKMILPIMTSLAVDFSTQVNDSIDAGRFTVLLNITGLGPGETGVFPTNLYTGAFGPNNPPAWNGSDMWPIRSDSLQGGNLATPKLAYQTAEVTVDAGGVRMWRSQGVGDLQLVLVTEGFTLVLPIHGAHMWMTLSPDNTSATNGLIAGVLDTEELIAEIAKTAGAFDPSLCPPSATFESIAQQIRQASDILANGTQDPNATCNGISIGLGFAADAALVGAVFDPPVAPDPCGP